MSEYGVYIALIYNDGSSLLSYGDLGERKISPIPLEAQEITIGRAIDNVVVLMDASISEYHARLERTEDGYQIVDLQSTNGTYVNFQRVSRHLLNEGERVQIGDYEFTYTKTHLNPHYD